MAMGNSVSRQGAVEDGREQLLLRAGIPRARRATATRRLRAAAAAVCSSVAGNAGMGDGAAAKWSTWTRYVTTRRLSSPCRFSPNTSKVLIAHQEK